MRSAPPFRTVAPLPDMPTWVHVWFWMRVLREPQVWTPLPQQGINPEAMSMNAYELYEREWAQSGSRSTSSAEVLSAMGAGSIVDEIPF